MSNFDLKGYISRSFRDQTHKNKTIIDIFLDDPDYYDYLLDNQQVDARAAYFISKYSTQIKAAKHSNPGSRMLRCFQLANQFLDTYTMDDISWNLLSEQKAQEEYLKRNIITNTKFHEIECDNIPDRERETNLLCPSHYRKLRLVNILTVTDRDSNQYAVPTLDCPACSKPYTYVDFKKYNSILQIGRTTFTNLYPDAFPSLEKLFPDTKPPIKLDQMPPQISGIEEAVSSVHNPCFIFSDNPPATCINAPCKSPLMQRRALLFNSEHIQKKYVIKSCPDCGTTYLHTSVQKANENLFEVIGNVPKISEPDYSQPISDSHFQKISDFGNRTKLKQPSPQKAPVLKPTQSKGKNSKEISIRDFVVWKYSFNCHKKGHTVQQIDALITVMNRSGDLIQYEIPASYCKQCDTYFILESTYQRLKHYGTIVCRVTDEQTYLSEMVSKPQSGGMHLAPESILMQYGYNVRQSSPLTAKQRLNILKLIIDNGICSKDKVISHLDNMISLFGKRKNSNYELAISKWKSDRDDISRYRVGSNQKVIVKKIKLR